MLKKKLKNQRKTLKKAKEDIKKVYQYCKERLNGFEEGELEAKYIVSHVLNIGLNDIFLKKHLKVSSLSLFKIKRMLKRRLSGMPIQYVLGITEFYGYDFFCDKRALIPRSETEMLCEKALSLASNDDKLLDLCTGTGCIGITLSKENPSLNVTCSDISSNALRLAKKNNNHNSADVKLIRSDLFENIDEKFDVIVSNPPYINKKDYSVLSKKVLDFEPKNALVSGVDGLDIIRKIIGQAKHRLCSGGNLLLEIGYDQKEKVISLLKENGYIDINTFSDYANFDRIVIARRK